MMKVMQSLASECHMKYSLKPNVPHWPSESILYLLKAGSSHRRSLGQTFQSMVIHSMDQNSSKIILSKSHPVEKYFRATVTVSLESYFINIIKHMNALFVINAPFFNTENTFSSLRTGFGWTDIQRTSFDNVKYRPSLTFDGST